MEIQENVMKRIEVVAAIIHDGEGRIFATQRGYGDYKDYWEFPGGKIEAGETPDEALKREIWEELGEYSWIVLEHQCDLGLELMQLSLLVLLWTFPVILMSVINCHGAGGCHLAC